MRGPRTYASCAALPARPRRPIHGRLIVDTGALIAIEGGNGHGVAYDGQPYDNSYAWIMRMRDGEVIHGTAFYDPISFNEVWARVEPRA